MKKYNTGNLGLRGLGTALITPFKDGAVDYKAYKHLLDRQIRGHVDFLVPLGTTGETPCLSDKEKIRILELTKENSAGKTVVAGVGTNSLYGTVRNIKTLEGHGVDAFLVVVPYYNKPTQRGQYEYFKAVAAETDKPIILYNVPGRTGANMTAETTCRLAEDVENIVAVKEASGDLEQIHKILRGRPRDFDVLSGNDDQTYDIIMDGGVGVISVASNICPLLMANFLASIRQSIRTGLGGAAAFNSKLMPLFKACFVESNPIPIKAALAAMGLISYELRLPLCPGEPSTTDLIMKVIRDLGINE
ncbi:MAG: 4-hydroxy-tetrahydrodipicolinate synthase [Bacteroidales bacterium]|nr:4-hydroxy-tetrahydrodipicolinate synthase [Bacteroidales bacterium]